MGVRPRPPRPCGGVHDADREIPARHQPLTVRTGRSRLAGAGKPRARRWQRMANGPRANSPRSNHRRPTNRPSGCPPVRRPPSRRWCGRSGRPRGRGPAGERTRVGTSVTNGWTSSSRYGTPAPSHHRYLFSRAHPRAAGSGKRRSPGRPGPARLASRSAAPPREDDQDRDKRPPCRTHTAGSRRPVSERTELQRAHDEVPGRLIVQTLFQIPVGQESGRQPPRRGGRLPHPGRHRDGVRRPSRAHGALRRAVPDPHPAPSTTPEHRHRRDADALLVLRRRQPAPGDHVLTDGRRDPPRRDSPGPARVVILVTSARIGDHGFLGGRPQRGPGGPRRLGQLVVPRPLRRPRRVRADPRRRRRALGDPARGRLRHRPCLPDRLVGAADRLPHRDRRGGGDRRPGAGARRPGPRHRSLLAPDAGPGGPGLVRRGPDAAALPAPLRVRPGDRPPAPGGRAVVATAGATRLDLRADAELGCEPAEARGSFTVRAGRSGASPSGTRRPTRGRRPAPPDAEQVVANAVAGWRSWAGLHEYQGLYRDQVRRSCPGGAGHDLPAERRGRGRGDHLAAGAAGRRPELRLPLRLGPGLQPHPPGAVAGGLPATRRTGSSPGWPGRWAGSTTARCRSCTASRASGTSPSTPRPPLRVRRQPAGLGRQRRVEATADRRARRDPRRRLADAALSGPDVGPTYGNCSAPWPTGRAGLAPAGRRDVGGPRRRTALPVVEGAVLDGAGPGGPVRLPDSADRPTSRAGRRPATRSGRRCWPQAWNDRPGRTPGPSTPTTWTPRSCSCRWSASCRGRPADALHRSRRWRGGCRRRPAPPLGRRPGRLRDLLVLAGGLPWRGRRTGGRGGDVFEQLADRVNDVGLLRRADRPAHREPLGNFPAGVLAHRPDQRGGRPQRPRRRTPRAAARTGPPDSRGQVELSQVRPPPPSPARHGQTGAVGLGNRIVAGWSWAARRGAPGGCRGRLRRSRGEPPEPARQIYTRADGSAAPPAAVALPGRVVPTTGGRRGRQVPRRYGRRPHPG